MDPLDTFSQLSTACSDDVAKITIEDVLAYAAKAEELRAEEDEYEMEVLLSDERELEGDIHTKNCQKNPGHHDFYSVKDLDLQHIPEPFRFPGFLEWVKFVATGTVKLFIGYTSVNRPDFLGFKKLRGSKITRVGSGYFQYPMGDKQFWELKPCPFTDCKESSEPHHQVGMFDVSTAAHVVCDDSEALKTTLEFLFDDETDISSVVKARGVSVKAIPAMDFTYLTCATHALDFWDRLQASWTAPRAELVIPMDSSITFTISHPHGCEKKITFGDLKDADMPMSIFDRLFEKPCPLLKDIPKPKPLATPICRKLTYTAATCPGSSGCLTMAIKKDNSGLKIFSAPHSKGGKSGTVNKSGLGTLIERKL